MLNCDFKPTGVTLLKFMQEDAVNSKEKKQLLQDYLKRLYRTDILNELGSEKGNLVFSAILDRQISELRRFLSQPGHLNAVANRIYHGLFKAEKLK